MKIIRIEKCDNNLCGLWRHRKNQHAVVCMKTGRLAEDPIPDWCPLEDAPEPQKYPYGQCIQCGGSIKPDSVGIPYCSNCGVTLKEIGEEIYT